jgi:hypothetical protein
MRGRGKILSALIPPVPVLKWEVPGLEIDRDHENGAFAVSSFQTLPKWALWRERKEGSVKMCVLFERACWTCWLCGGGR